MPAKKKTEEEEEFEEESDEQEDMEDDDTMEEDSFKCRVCHKEVAVDEGDDYVQICDNCQEDYNMDKLWSDFDRGLITEENLKTVDLLKYKLKKK
jgi:hypothetical protein